MHPDKPRAASSLNPARTLAPGTGWRATFLQNGLGHLPKGRPQAASDGAKMVLVLKEEKKERERER